MYFVNKLLHLQSWFLNLKSNKSSFYFTRWQGFDWLGAFQPWHKVYVFMKTGNATCKVFSVLNNILICNCLVLVQSYIASAKRYLVEQKILIWLACLVAIFWIVFSNSFLQSMAILRVLQKKQNYEKGPANFPFLLDFF